MKKCKKCGKRFEDSLEFCNICGEKLYTLFSIKAALIKNRKFIIIALLVVMVLGLTISVIMKEQRKLELAKAESDLASYNKSLYNYQTNPTTSDLKINSGWKTKTSGNYMYINGSVSNISSTKSISYFKIEAKFYDKKGNVIDSDWTNDGETLEPGESRKFEIMHKKDSSIYTTKLFVKEVK